MSPELPRRPRWTGLSREVEGRPPALDWALRRVWDSKMEIAIRRTTVRARTEWVVLSTVLLGLSNCGPAESDSGSGGSSSGGSAAGGSSSGGAASGGAVSSGGTASGGDSSGGASSGGASSTGGTAPSSGGGEPSGGADNSGGSGALPNWESNPANAEFFRACMDPSGHEIVLRVKTPDGCVELVLTDDLSYCVPLPPESGWCVKSGGGNYYSQPELCDAPGLTETGNPSVIVVTVNEQIEVSEGARLDAIFAIYWGGSYTTAPSDISVSGCIANCEERDCRE